MTFIRRSVRHELRHAHRCLC